MREALVTPVSGKRTIAGRREALVFGVIALVAAFALTRGLVGASAYTDAYYHFNAAERLANGQGLTDAYLWTYIGAPDSLPAPSHLYWMPLTSIVAALGMTIFGVPGDHAAAQVPFALMLATTAAIGFWLGGRISGHRRGAWIAGLMALFAGFFTRYWGAIDTFTPYALIGSACLAVMGIAVSRPKMIAWFGVGALAALAHLTRADGLLLLGVGGLVAVWMGVRPAARPSKGLATEESPVNGAEQPASAGLQAVASAGGFEPRARRTLHAASLRLLGWLFSLVIGYLLVMLPWSVRNLNAIGSPLPLGGMQAIWLREYNDLFSYPPDASPQTLFADGLNTFIQSRREAFDNNLATFIAVEGLVAMTPFMLIGLWARRRDPYLTPFWVYALLLHVAMTLVFPFPGYRGGLFHSAAALVPFWAALGVTGIDAAVAWVARRRRRWNAAVAGRLFSGALLALAGALSLSVGFAGRVPPSTETPALYAELMRRVPSDARIMINDPAGLYFHTKLGGVVLPNETPDAVLAIASQYDVDYLLLELDDAAIPAGLRAILDAPPDFLTPLPPDFANARLYAIDRQTLSPR